MSSGVYNVSRGVHKLYDGDTQGAGASSGHIAIAERDASSIVAMLSGVQQEFSDCALG